MTSFAPCKNKSLSQEKFMAFGQGLETYEREKKSRAPLLTNNLKLWKSRINTIEFSHDICCDSHSVIELPTHGSCVERTSKVIQVDGLLKGSECQSVIEAANSIGFMSTRDIAVLNFPEYVDDNTLGSKNSARILLVEDQHFADLLWNRLKDLILDIAPISVLESPYYGRIPLKAVGVCPLMRILRYDEGGQFKPHKDGVDFLPKGPDHGDVCQSRLTLALYLNPSIDEDTTPTSFSSSSGPHSPDSSSVQPTFQGGAFRFLQDPVLQPRAVAEHLPACTVGSIGASPHVPLLPVYSHYPEGGVEVRPAVGRAILFSQDAYHEGLPVYGGSKYMIQTSVYYECEPSPSSSAAGAPLPTHAPTTTFLSTSTSTAETHLLHGIQEIKSELEINETEK